VKLTTVTQVSVDGVMQGLGGPDEDRRGGADTGPDLGLELVDSQSTPNGVSIQVYRPTGRPRYATATPDPST
jgi:hypothetical protein